jgi:hypothetical protein
VKYRHDVIGSAWPPDSPLQILVHAGNKWYPQGPVAFDGAMWSTKVWFGNPDSKPGGRYKVIAMCGGTEVTTAVGELPKHAAYSQEVTVTRID